MRHVPYGFSTTRIEAAKMRILPHKEKCTRTTDLLAVGILFALGIIASSQMAVYVTTQNIREKELSLDIRKKVKLITFTLNTYLRGANCLQSTPNPNYIL